MLCHSGLHGLHSYDFIENTERHMFDKKEGKSTGEVSNISVWMFYSINNVQCWELFYKRREEEKKRINHTVSTETNISTVPENNGM